MAIMLNILYPVVGAVFSVGEKLKFLIYEQ